MENKYTRIREKSGLPGIFIMRYLDAGYDESVYTYLENGRVHPVDRYMRQYLTDHPEVRKEVSCF